MTEDRTSELKSHLNEALQGFGVQRLDERQRLLVHEARVEPGDRKHSVVWMIVPHRAPQGRLCLGRIPGDLLVAHFGDTQEPARSHRLPQENQKNGRGQGTAPAGARLHGTGQGPCRRPTLGVCYSDAPVPLHAPDALHDPW